MPNPFNYPFLVLSVSLFIFWSSAWAGGRLRLIWTALKDEHPEDFKFVIGGMLTLLALVIGFTFSMAVSRYDLRKNNEEQEANAIGTEYVRADQLSPADSAKLQDLLRKYTDLRILFYVARNDQELHDINARTIRLQTEMWSIASKSVEELPAPMAPFILGGMNDVLNSQGYTQAAWWNRIPIGAWTLMIVIAVFCNVLIGYGAQGRGTLTLIVLPISLSISLFLIADIDSPRGGAIRVHPQNLESLAESLHSQ
jgi:hypothetical protein